MSDSAEYDLEGSRVEQVMPIVNLNGTSREALIEQTLTAWEALEQAIRALCAMSPNGRDYQISPPGHYEIARDQHLARIQTVRAVQEQINKQAEALQS